MACPPSINARTVFFNWLLLIGLCALIFIQSHGLVLTDIPLPVHMDKVLHFICFAVLAVLFFRAYQALPFRTSIKILVILSVLSTIGYAVGDEVHQSFIPLRVADKFDIIADIAGAIFGLGLYLVWHRRGGRKASPQFSDHCLS
jgi:hypothetical protein